MDYSGFIRSELTYRRRLGLTTSDSVRANFSPCPIGPAAANVATQAIHAQRYMKATMVRE